jgi:hypothetical protein
MTFGTNGLRKQYKMRIAHIFLGTLANNTKCAYFATPEIWRNNTKCALFSGQNNTKCAFLSHPIQRAFYAALAHLCEAQSGFFVVMGR